MPYINGNFHRSAGQGYAQEKAKMGGEKHEDAPAMDGESNSKGSVMHVKHHGGSKFSVTKDEDPAKSPARLPPKTLHPAT